MIKEKRNISSLEDLESENTELKMLMRRLSHEMGNALTMLGGSIFYLENELVDKAGEEVLYNLKDDYKYMCQLFANLREYNHFQAIRKEIVSLEDVAYEIRTTFKKLKKELLTDEDDHINFWCSYLAEANNTYIYVDKTKLRQVIINILKNSIEAMCINEYTDDLRKKSEVQKNKEICVCISLEDMCDEIMADKGKRQMSHIEIRDNGKGIAENNMAKIFNPMCTFDKKQGTGLGLAVAKKIIEDHKGKIKAVSALGTGTAMHIYLPILD